HNTTMREFPMCRACSTEYKDPINRRFHAQTIACPDCGPRVYLASKDGEIIECKDPVREAGVLLEEGYIVAVKGNGGFHLATATTLSKPITRLRRAKHRRQKPFAVMARDMNAVKTFAEVSEHEAALLQSYIKPIVLLRKSENYYLSDLISPGLHNIGVMLPYTGLHVMLFDSVGEPAFVMTSANPPKEPIITDNAEAIRKLGKDVDYFLLHNRRIAQRCDDSVVRFHGKSPLLIRRSRGYAPEPVRVANPSKRSIVGVGAEENVTICLLRGNRAVLSQHVGDVETLETLQFMKEAFQHLINLTGSDVEVVTCDLHPTFNTTMLAENLESNLDCTLIRVQHHHAHLASLMAEHDLKEVVGIVCDGFGYGLDGNAWGGEILYSNIAEFRRVGHLQQQPMVGGDLATRWPIRMAAGILAKSIDIDEWLLSRSDYLPHGKKEAQLVIDQLKRGKVQVWTTSCGRVLDAVSSVLEICNERTYEGEPAMKLESVAYGGRDVLNLKPKIYGDEVLDTSFLLTQIYTNVKKYHISDLAYSAEEYLAKGLALIAIHKADELGVKDIGFTGGVAYNEHITSTLRRIIKENGFRFFVHRRVPPGDGGISLGQAMVAAYQNL
ncbi:carbamoyltransferase HypF, partial [Candidatus Bathyarchaeota archaeon]